MGDHEGGRRRADGFMWMWHALGWAVGGAAGYLFALGLATGLARGGSVGEALSRGLSFIVVAISCGLIGVIPLWLAVVVVGGLVLWSTRGFPRDGESVRRWVFVLATAIVAALLMAFVLRGLIEFLIQDNGRRVDSVRHLLVATLPVSAIACVAAWFYYPRERDLVGLDEFQVVPKPQRPHTLHEESAEPPAPSSAPDGPESSAAEF